MNRPKNNDEFMSGNFGFGETLLNALKKHGNKAPIMLSSSIQATLIGRYGESDYGKSKLAGEELFFEYEKETGAPVYVYRFPNLMGIPPELQQCGFNLLQRGCKRLPFTVNDRAIELELLYIDDLLKQC